MTGPEHYRQAERLLATSTGPVDWPALVAQAQVHATLALAAATAYPAVKDHVGDEGSDSRAWTQVTA